MKIYESWIQEWLKTFGVKGKVTDTLEFLNKDEEIDGERQIRVILGVETEQEVVVFKLVHESMFNRELIESQITFSQKLRESGIATTYQYRTQEGYTQEVVLEGIRLCLSCEAFMGSEPEALTEELAYEIGKMMGNMHRISEEQKLEIGFSRVYHEVMNKSSYKKIWNNQYPNWIDKNWIDKITEKHDSLMEEIQSKWTELPKAAVQGDIFGVNNVYVTEEEIGVYDYNLASDEVLVGDFLMYWYRTVADLSMHTFLLQSNVDHMWKAYTTGYLESRSLSELERKIGNPLSAVLGVLHLSKLAIELKEEGRKEEAIQCLAAAERSIEKPRWIE